MEPQSRRNYEKADERQLTTSALASRLPVSPLVTVTEQVNDILLFLTVVSIMTAISCCLVALVNGWGFSGIILPAAMLSISVPAYLGLLAFRKRAGWQSRSAPIAMRRIGVGVMQVLCFGVCLVSAIVALFSLFMSWTEPSVAGYSQTLLASLCVIAVFGLVLFYYTRVGLRMGRRT